MARALVALLVFTASRALALEPNRHLTQYFHRAWQMQQGLPQASIFAIHQTRDGYLWLGTQTGMIRFDGVRFTTLRDPENAANAAGAIDRLWIRDFLEDSAGDLWLATDNAGLVRLHGEQVTRYTRADGLPSDDLRCLLLDRAGDLWIGTADGLARRSANSFTAFRQSDGLEPKQVLALCETADGALWIGGEGNRISVYDHAKFESGIVAELPASASINALLAAADGAVWIGSSQGLACFRDGKQQRWTAADGLANDYVYSLAESPTNPSAKPNLPLPLGEGRGEGSGNCKLKIANCKLQIAGLAAASLFLEAKPPLPLPLGEGRGEGSSAPSDIASNTTTLWIGTADGFSRLQNGEFESFRSRDGLSQSTVYTLCLDREGSLWAGTKHGLNQFIDRRTIPFTTSEGLPSNDSGPVMQDRDGNIWVGTLGAGLSRFDGRHFARMTVDDGLASDTIQALADGGPGGLWAGTDKGLNHLRDGRVDQTLTAGSIRCLLPVGQVSNLPVKESDGQVENLSHALWIGTSAGLAMLRDGKIVSTQVPESLKTGTILALAEHRGHVYVSVAGHGLYRGSGLTFEPVPLDGQSAHDIDAFFSDDVLWIGTRGGGLIALDGEKPTTLTIKDGLYDDDIYGIVPDDQNRLWMACSKGIFSLDRGELHKFLAHEITTLSSIPFSPTDALRTIECKPGVQPGACGTRSGAVWFSTIRGLLVIEPKRLQRKLPPPAVLIEETLVNGSRAPTGALGRLPPGPANLEFRYTALSFVSPTRIAFRYQLDGYDRDWVAAGARREAFYTNLPPGSYRFRVAAQNVDGLWTEAASPVSLVVQPYFYQRAWFLPLCALAACLAAWRIYRLRVRRIKEQLRAVLAERSRIARELHDTLLQGFSGVTMEMQALSARLQPSDQRASLEEIIADAGNCLREARRSVTGLRNAPEDPTEFVAALAQTARQITETGDVRLRLRLEPLGQKLPAEVQYNLLRIAQEAITNAVKHAAPPRTIEVALDSRGGRLLLSIRDDGAGFDAKNGAGVWLGHYGLIGMRERANQIGAELRIESEPNRGTLIAIQVPTTANPSNGHTAAARDAEKSTM